MTTPEELDGVLDELDRRARNDWPRIVLMDTDDHQNYFSIGVGAEMVPVNHADDRPGAPVPCYAHSVGPDRAGEPQEWAYSNTWNEVPSERLIPADVARLAARHWVLTHERPDNIRWEAD
ncbi:MAG: Imm1 family immunity protein [Actinomycetota bacterium]|nr:Imm1 family immunity protein [Actinomycetota bacterium]